MASQDDCDNSIICEKLDDLALYILNVMQNIILERQYLDDNLKDGFINMAKSRYLMNGRQISMHQINTTGLHASKKVVSDVDSIGGVKYSSFQISDSVKSKKEISNQPHCDIINRFNKLKTTESEKDENESLMEDFSNHKASTNTENPLRWFGVLVPESLKVSQSRFEKVIETCTKIASLQNQLKVLCEEYKSLRKKKTELNSSV